MAEDWTTLECELIVADYLDMLAKELSGLKFTKAEHNKNLRMKLTTRSKGSVEFKHQNISAVLRDLGKPYITGYKPAVNYQQELKRVLISRFDLSRVDELAMKIIDSPTAISELRDWEKYLVDAPVPEKRTIVKDRAFEARGSYNIISHEKANKKLGDDGEEFIFSLEKKRLAKIGRQDLVQDIEWTSKVKGDGAGYDIRSFDGKTDEELFIEVKTTKFGKHTQFDISRNEVEFSKAFSDQYSLYRVFEFRNKPSYFQLEGDISKKVNIEPTHYRANF